MLIEWLLVLLGIVLTFGTAIFVAAEFAFVTVDRAAVARAAEQGDHTAIGLRDALRSLSTQLSGAQLGITTTTLSVGYLIEPSAARLLSHPLRLLGLSGTALTGLSVTVALLLATGLQMVVGELVPKNLAVARPLSVARRVAPLQRGFTRAARPLISLLNGASNRIVRALGLEPQEELRSARSPQELAFLVDRSAEIGTLPAPTADLLARSLAFSERTAADVMTPRVQVRFVEADVPLTEVAQAAVTSGHSRFPVVSGSADDVVGMVHVKDAVKVPAPYRAERRVSDVMLPPVLVPGSASLDALLPELRRHGLQIAVVVDEYGGTDGVVTLEDVIEEIVGDIPDEHDSPRVGVIELGDSSWSLSGLLRPDEIDDLVGIRLPESRVYDTIGGLVLALLGRVPVAGDVARLEMDGRLVTLTVERMDGRRVDRVLVNVRRPASTPPAGRGRR